MSLNGSVDEERYLISNEARILGFFDTLLGDGPNGSLWLSLRPKAFDTGGDIDNSIEGRCSKSARFDPFVEQSSLRFIKKREAFLVPRVLRSS